MNPNDYVNQKERALSRKLELIEIKGGRCEKCGYNKNIAALEFHHLDPKVKKFNLDSRHLSNTTKLKILEELNKCILVCSNCHRELHNPQFDNENIDNIINEINTKHMSLLLEPKSKKKVVCPYCGKEFEYIKGKRYCSKECRNASINEKYPPYEKLTEKYNEVKSWEKVAKHFNITRRIINRIRKLNE